jgi:hypothetical protein
MNQTWQILKERGIERCSHWRCGRPSSEASDEIASRVCCSASVFTFPTPWCVGEARGRLATRVERWAQALVLAAATPARETRRTRGESPGTRVGTREEAQMMSKKRRRADL